MTTKLESFKLMTLIQGNYEARAERDTDFAAWASETLGFKVSHAQVRAARQQLGIPNTGEKPAPPQIPRDLLIEAIAALRYKARMEAGQSQAPELFTEEETNEWDWANELEKFL